MVTILRSGTLRWVLRLVVRMKIGVGIRWHEGDRLVWVRCLLWYRAIGTWKRVIRHGG
jgi:hypothetical protein